MKTVLEIDTAKTLYRPINIKINGRIFRIKELTLEALEGFQDLRKQVVKGDISAFRTMLDSVLEGPAEELGKLSMANLAKIIRIAVKKGGEEAEKEKNAQKPGQKT